MLSVSMGRRRRAGARPVSVGPAGLLASGLLLRPSLASLVPLRADRTLTLAGVTSTLVVWPGPVSEMERDANISRDANKICAIILPGAAVSILTGLNASSVCGEDLRSPALLQAKR